MSNDRSLADFDIFNIQSDKATDIIDNKTVGVYDPLGTVILTMFEPIIWPGGGTEYPPYLRSDYHKCIIKEEDQESS